MIRLQDVQELLIGVWIICITGLDLVQVLDGMIELLLDLHGLISVVVEIVQVFGSSHLGVLGRKPG
jgi:hypothetical protein